MPSETARRTPCTTLQLANFSQDVTVDLEKDRVYLPLDLQAAPQREVARKLFLEGLPPVKTVDRRHGAPCGHI
jgi:phytoene/squalene synthetase